MPDINEPTEAEIEAVKADQQWWQQVEEPLGLRLGGWTFRKHALFFDISTGAAIELPGSVAERVIAARRVSSAPSFADVRIKLLEWVERSQDRGDGTSEPNGDWEALATTGRYYIELLGDRWSLQRDDYTDLGVFDSPDEAKAAGQTDYERRIRSAIDVVPAPSFADGIEAEVPAPKPDPAIAELVERLRERTKIAYIGSCKCGECQLVPITLIHQAIAALTASNDRVAELERENFALAANQCDGPKHGDEHGHEYCLVVEKLKRELIAVREDRAAAWHKCEERRQAQKAAEAEVSRLKAGAVTDWQLIESVPKDGRSIAVWLPATATEQPHAFAPVSICEDGTWWDDSTGDQIEPLAATYWAPIHAPSALSNQAGASK